MVYSLTVYHFAMKTAHFLFFFIGAALLSTGAVQAQANRDTVPLGPSNKAFSFKEKRIKTEDLPSPDFTVRTVAKNWKPEKWHHLEVENFQLDVKDDRARGVLGIGKKDLFIGPVVVSFYMHVKDPNATSGRAPLMLLKKDITYVDVPLNKPTCFSAWMSPITIANLTGGTGSFRPERIGYEVKYKGEPIYRWSSQQRDFWNVQSASVVRDDNNKYPILNKDETPFAMLWYDRYPPIKKVDSTALGETIQKLSTPEEETTLTPPATETATPPASGTNRTGRTSSRTAPTGTPGF